MNRIKDKFIFSLAIAVTTFLVFAFANAFAQSQASTTNVTNSSQPLETQNSSSIPIEKTINDALFAKTNISMSEAINTAEQLTGNNSKVTSASLTPLNGSLIYNIKTLDTNQTLNRVIIDPGNGSVLSNEKVEKVDTKYYNNHNSHYLDNTSHLKHNGEWGCKSKDSGSNLAFKNERMVDHNLQFMNSMMRD